MIAPQVGCILMAAGASSRFGSDKLAVDLDGRSLLRRACEAVPREKLSKVCIVTARAEGISLAAEFGFQHVLNDRPEAGASRTVQLGLEAIQPCDAALFMTADQPLLRSSTVSRLIGAWLEQPKHIAALAHAGARGNPCLFPARYFPELLALEGECGGSAVIRRHPDALLLVEAEASELLDVDRRSDLDMIRDVSAR